MGLAMDVVSWWTSARVGALGSVLAAVGTITAFIVGFIQISRERSLRQEADRRAQAQQVSGWIAPRTTSPDAGESGLDAILLNNSQEPVYRVVVWLVYIQGSGPRIGEEVGDAHPPATFAVLPPGRYETLLHGWDAGMNRRAGVELAFTNAAGHHWIRRSSGQLVNLKVPPADYYDIGDPHAWFTPAEAKRRLIPENGQDAGPAEDGQ